MKKLVVFSFMILIVFLMLCGRIVVDDGMNSSLHHGDIVFVVPIQPKVGDIVSMTDPLHPDGNQVFRRVLAVENMSFSYERNGTVLQNGRRITQKDMGVFGSRQAIQERFEDENGSIKKWTVMRLVEPIASLISDVRVPKGHVYLLADQRDEGLDSRIWGSIPQKQITGVVYLRMGKSEPWSSWITWNP